METKTKSISDNIIDGLKKAINELEEFQVQLALGKSEAAEKYEDIKKLFHRVISDIHSKVDTAEEKAIELRGKLDELMIQLSLGKAETKEKFIEQKKIISESINDIENFIFKNPLGIKLQSKLRLEMEKFKIKMEILNLRFTLGKMDVKDSFESNKEMLHKKIEELKQNFNKYEPDFKENWEHFFSEINKAFTHLKSAFIKS